MPIMAGVHVHHCHPVMQGSTRGGSSHAPAASSLYGLWHDMMMLVWIPDTAAYPAGLAESCGSATENVWEIGTFRWLILHGMLCTSCMIVLQVWVTWCTQ